MYIGKENRHAEAAACSAHSCFGRRRPEVCSAMPMATASTTELVARLCCRQRFLFQNIQFVFFPF